MSGIAQNIQRTIEEMRGEVEYARSQVRMSLTALEGVDHPKVDGEDAGLVTGGCIVCVAVNTARNAMVTLDSLEKRLSGSPAPSEKMNEFPSGTTIPDDAYRTFEVWAIDTNGDNKQVATYFTEESAQDFAKGRRRQEHRMMRLQRIKVWVEEKLKWYEDVGEDEWVFEVRRIVPTPAEEETGDV